MQTNATVFVVDDDAAVRESLRHLLEAVGMRVATFATAEEFLGAYKTDEPGCLVLDMRLSGMSGVELLEELRSVGSVLPAIVITGFAEVQTAVQSIKAGAIELIEKPLRPEHLIERIRTALEMSREMVERVAAHAEMASRVSRLTPRERQVMELVIEGKPNKVIAAELGLSPRTVEVYRARVMIKTRAESLAELIRVGLAVRD